MGHRIDQIVQFLLIRSHVHFVDRETSQRDWYSSSCKKKTQMVLNLSSAQMPGKNSHLNWEVRGNLNLARVGLDCPTTY